MEFHIDRNVFLEGVQKTLGIVERKSIVPILNNILIRTEEGRIKIVATNREIGLISRYDAQINIPGDITISALKLFEMIKETQDDTLQFIKNEQHQVTMKSGRAIYRISGLPADLYPQVLEVDEIPLYKVSGADLANLVRKTSFAASTDEMRANLTGVFFETEASGEDGPPRMKMVATDGHRLSSALGPVGSAGGLVLEKGIVVPRKGMEEIRKIAEAEEAVWIGVDHGMFVMKTDNLTIKVSLIDADYPDYRRVIPKNKGVLAIFSRDVLLHALRRMGVVSNENYNDVVIELSDGRMALSSNNPDVGEANDEIAVSYNGGDLTNTYNVRYVIEAIKAVDEEEVSFEINEGMKPGVIMGVGNDDYLSIVMPLKLKE